MTTVQLEFNGLKWTLCEDLHVMCKFSKYFLELVEKTDKNSILFLNGFHFETFKYILDFCKHHCNEFPVIKYTKWDKDYYNNITLDGSLDKYDFVHTCLHYGFEAIVKLFL